MATFERQQSRNKQTDDTIKNGTIERYCQTFKVCLAIFQHYEIKG